MAATELIAALAAKNLTITTAESCTGGLIASAITDVSGASNVFHQGAVTYANEAKISLLDVDAKTLETHGAVSEEVARQMAEGAREKAGADIAISATGIAGPTGGSAQKPVGLVYIAIATAKTTRVGKYLFEGSRTAIRTQAVAAALQMALEEINSSGNILK